MTRSQRRPHALGPRGEKKWLVRVYVGHDQQGKRQYSARTVEGTANEARQELTKMLRDTDTKMLVRRTTQTFSEYLEDWYKTKIDVTEQTLNGYKYLAVVARVWHVSRSSIIIRTMSVDAKPAPADHEIHQAYKVRMQRRVISTLTFVALVYFFALFPQQLLDSIAGAVAARRAQWLSLTAGAASNVTLVWVLSFILFASDSAFKGASRTAIWARSLFASRAAVEKFKCTDGQASALWFKFFDTWGLRGSPNRNLLINSYSATYAARAVFYLQRALIVFLLLSLLSIALHWKLFSSYQGTDGSTRLVIHVLAVSLFAAGLAFIGLTNRLPRGNVPATGCWARVQDVFDRSRTLFEHDVLRHASTLEEGFTRVEALRRELIAADASGG